ncbi:hypothetical protein CF319_g8344 [Tilletia indica]|nr:hypothetical protein CF319_g8344 [Tilletia indica]
MAVLHSHESTLDLSATPLPLATRLPPPISTSAAEKRLVRPAHNPSIGTHRQSVDLINTNRALFTSSPQLHLKSYTTSRQVPLQEHRQTPRPPNSPFRDSLKPPRLGSAQQDVLLAPALGREAASAHGKAVQNKPHQTSPTSKLRPNSTRRRNRPQDWIHLRDGPLALRGLQYSYGPACPDRRVPATGFSGSTCEAEVFAFATGPNAFFGRAASQVEESNHEAGHPQHPLVKIGLHSLSPTPIFVIALMIVQRAAFGLIVEGILTVIPTILAVSLAIGAEQSARRKALGIHTAPIEKIPVVTILYSDKTSTVKTSKITNDPETGKVSSKGQAHQRGDHSRLRVSASNRTPIPSIRCREYLAQLSSSPRKRLEQNTDTIDSVS